MKILGIESSCDETAAAVIEKNAEKVKLLSNVVSSSLSLHAKTQGIIPEVAAREQLVYILPVIEQALKDAKTGLENIDAIAVTYGPGLIGSLLIGVETAKTLAFVYNKPIIPVNHLIGHIYANFIGEKSKIKNQKSKLDARRYSLNALLSFPAIALIVSGGHTDLLLMKNHQQIKWLGGTRDDAAGEAFDKIGRLFGLPYPGGPSIEKAAKNGDPKAYHFPRALMEGFGKDFLAKGQPASGWDFSFSGLKTAVYRKVQTIKQLNNETINNLCASVQAAVFDVVVEKTLRAVKEYRAQSLLLGGGVAANQTLRDEFSLKIARLAESKREDLKFKIPLFAPEKRLCTDNAVMIATAACFVGKPVSWKTVTADPELYFN